MAADQASSGPTACPHMDPEHWPSITAGRPAGCSVGLHAPARLRQTAVHRQVVVHRQAAALQDAVGTGPPVEAAAAVVVAAAVAAAAA